MSTGAVLAPHPACCLTPRSEPQPANGARRKGVIAQRLVQRVQQTMSNGAVGFALTVAAYLYYSLWVLLTPFVEKDVVWFHNLFPDTWWALAFPTALLVLGLTCVITFVGMMSS